LEKISFRNHCNNGFIRKITGKKVLYYRPPFGITNPSIAKAIRKSGLVTMAWNIRTFDTLAKDPQRPIRKIEKYWNPHSIILLHDRLNVTVDILQYLLENGLIKQSPIFESQGSGISEDK
jgi:peptidoglycan/xylan/chitin deacetylase (PgdA/CDA1 family)